jgi:hypothetical protein
MGTSNWQNIPFCIEALMKIAPQRVLDVGVGFGRWGIITREFCDVWYGRIFKPQWAVHIEGIEGFKKSIADYHYTFYNQIHFGDARKIIPSLKDNWDVVIFGDVLEHFERIIAEDLLNWCLDHSTYVLVNIPLGSNWLQEESYENPYEVHLSTWVEEDFDRFGLCRKALFFDYIGRPFGSFILSHNDPKNLRESLFSLFPMASALESKDSQRLQGTGAPFVQTLQLRNQLMSDELNRIMNSRSYRAIERLKKSPFASTLVKLGQILIPGKAPEINVKTIRQEPAQIVDQSSSTSYSTGRVPLQKQKYSPNRTESDQTWVENQLKLNKPLSINDPEWRGVLASANELFDNIYTIPDQLDENQATFYAELIKDAAPPCLIIQGFPLSYYLLVKAIRKAAPRIPIYAIWHGNLLHTKEDYAWNSFRLLKALHEEGDIRRVGFVKKGMAEIMSTVGMQAYFVMNYVRSIPAVPSQPFGNGKHIGIWAEPDWGWKKLPYAMLASLNLVPDSVGHIHNVSPRAQEFGDLLKVNAKYEINPLPHEKAVEKMAKMHLNIYVSLTECAPMLPLESLSVGSPCLLGPTSHYFLDHEYLHQRLVVPQPDNAESIAQHANQALSERAEIINAYKAYAPEYNQRALQALSDFLEYPLVETG